MFYRKKNLLEEDTTMKRFEYLPLCKELKTQTELQRNSI